MKPHHAEETRKAQALGLVRARLKVDLAWLRGYPRQWQPGVADWILPFQARGNPEPITVDSATITRASLALVELPARFPRVLGDVVGDGAVWSANSKAALDWVKQGLRTGRPPRSLFAAERRFGTVVAAKAAALVGSEPLLSDLLADLSWYFSANPREGADMLDWVSSHRQELARVARVAPRDHDITALCLRLGALRSDTRGSRLAVLERLVLDSRTWQGPHADLFGKDLLPKLKAGQALDLSQRDSSSLGLWLSAFTTRLLTEEPSVRQRILDLFSVTYAHLDPLLEKWRTGWEMIEQLQERVATTGAACLEWDYEKIGKTLDSVGQKTEPHREVHSALATLARLARTASPAQQRDILALVARMPPFQDGEPTAILALTNPVSDKDLAEWLAAMGRAVKRHASLADGLPWTLDRPEALRSRETCDRFFDALAQIGSCRDSELRYSFHLRLSLFCSITSDASVAARWLKRLSSSDLEADNRLDSESLGGVARLCRAEPDTFLAVLQKLVVLPWHDQQRLFSLVGHEPQVRQALLDGHGALLCRGLTYADHLGAGVSFPAQVKVKSRPEWILGFAADLKEALAELAATTPDAEKVALKHLGPAYRPPEEIQRELRALRDRLRREDNPAIRARIQSLESLLVARPALSPQRIQTLRAKLGLASRRIHLERWVAHLDAELRLRLPKMLGLDCIPDTWWQEPILKCLLAIVRLPGEFQTLARLVLQRRLGPPPWDLRDHGKNARFLAGLTHKGVRIEPWLDGIGAHSHVVPGVGDVVLQLEEDPLEVLRMGAHFQTCLSPFAFNYFSVMVNMADINKRVLYLRNRSGKVLGRSLLGLTAEGTLVAFFPYCHASIAFESMVRDFTEELSSRMGVPVLADGRVPPLLSSRWYDDGGVDVHGRLQCLSYDSPFRQTLQAIPVDEFVPALLKAIHPFELDERLLPAVLDLHELQARPELVLPLLPYLHGLAELPPITALRAVEILHLAACPERIDASLTARALEAVPEIAVGHWSFALVALAGIEPQALLRRLREKLEARDRRARSGFPTDALFPAAEALLHLGRKKQAIELFREALASHELYGKEIEHCQSRLNQLEQELQDRRMGT